MAEITAALDEPGANKLLDTAIALIGTQTKSGSGNLGPFIANYTIQGTLTNGDVDLIPPDIIRIVDLRLDWDLDLSFGFDLSTILPDFCLPQVCVRIPCVGRVCTPKICIDWPTITHTGLVRRLPEDDRRFPSRYFAQRRKVEGAGGHRRRAEPPIRRHHRAAPRGDRRRRDADPARHPLHRPVPRDCGQCHPCGDCDCRRDRVPRTDHHAVHQRPQNSGLRELTRPSQSSGRSPRSADSPWHRK